MSKTYTLHPVAIVHGMETSNSHLSNRWDHLANRQPENLYAGADGSWVPDAYSGNKLWNQMHCVNFIFDQATLDILRTKNIQSVNFSTKVSGTLKGSDAASRHHIRYRLSPESGDGVTTLSNHWVSASDADATAVGTTVAGRIGSSTPSEQTVSDQTINVTLENSIPKYGYVVGPASIYNSTTHGLLTFSATLSDTTLTVVTDEIESYSVIYSGNGGEGAPPAQTYSVGASVVLSDIKPTRLGYKFLGWSQSSDAVIASFASGSTQTFNDNVTLYAVWAPQTYTIAFHANGGSNPPAPQTKTYGVDLTLSSSQPTRDGYDFLGWAGSNAATEAEHEPGGTYAENGNATLYAVWRVIVSTHSLTFDANGGIGAPIAQTQTYSVEDQRAFTVPADQPTRDGHEFKGWSNTSNGVVEYIEGDTIPAAADRTLYAVWEKVRFTVIYDANGGSTPPASQTKQKGVPLIITGATPEKLGAVFMGWATAAAATVPDYHGGDSFATDADTTLYAVWGAVRRVSAYVVRNGVPVACKAYAVVNGSVVTCDIYGG